MSRETSTGSISVQSVLSARPRVASVQVERLARPSGPLLIRGFRVRAPWRPNLRLARYEAGWPGRAPTGRSGPVSCPHQMSPRWRRGCWIRTADERRRRRAAGVTSGAGARAADPAATVGQAWPGLLVSRSGSSGTGSSAGVCVCPMAEPGVMMALEINPTQCRGCRGGAHRPSLVELRFVKAVGLSICGTTALPAAPSSAASRSGHGRAARGG